MKTTFKITQIGLALVLAAGFATSANADTANGRVDATVIAPLTIAAGNDMLFGSVAGGTGTGTVVLTTGGGISTTGDATAVPASGAQAGTFDISGAPGASYAISFSASGTLTDGGSNSMTVDSFSDTASGTIPGGGTETISVGATLNVGASQAAGSYSTTNTGGSAYTVTVNYN